MAACAAFAVYALRPYGYIKEDFNTGRLRARSVDCSAIEAQLPRQFTVYKILTLDRDAQIQRCQAVFDALQAAGLKPGNASDNIAQNLSRGRMSSGDLFSGTVDELVCLKCEIQYNIDSKGFYRPVYLIECTADGKPAKIKTPAI